MDRGKSNQLGIRVTPELIVSQHISAKPFFEVLMNSLGVGHLTTKKNEVKS